MYWYNMKYDRVVHLFQDRFKSEPIEDNDYFLSCIRYIHQNPLKAEFGTLEEYPYSSYLEYVEEEPPTYTDTEFLFSIIDKEQLIKICKLPCEKQFIDLPEESSARITDEIAREKIFEITGCKSVSAFQALE